MTWYLYAFISALGVSATTLLEKKDLKRLHSFEYVVVLSALNLLLACFLLPWVNFHAAPLVLLAIYLASLLGTFGLWLSAKALRHLEVSQVAPLSSLQVLFTLLFAVLLLGERISVPQALGIFIFLYGLWFLNQADYVEDVISHPLRALGQKSLTKVGFYRLLTVLAIALLGLSAILDKWALGRVDILSFIFLVHLGLFFNHFLIYFSLYRRLDYLKETISGINFNIFFVSVFTLVARLAYAQALTLAPVSLVAPIKRLSALFSTFFGGIFFKEEGLALRVMVSVLMFLGVYLIVK